MAYFTNQLILWFSFQILARISSSTVTFQYGKHFPFGQAGVNYAYSAEGMWKKMTNINYTWNFYPQYSVPKHPYNKSALIAEATINHRTALDANGHLLLDYNHDGEIDTHEGDFAFHEHNARGARGKTCGQPFLNFWFDDNSLAKFLSKAYGLQTPDGLSEYSSFTRWSIIGGTASNYFPYKGSYNDQLALDGLYYITVGDADTAFKK